VFSFPSTLPRNAFLSLFAQSQHGLAYCATLSLHPFKAISYSVCADSFLSHRTLFSVFVHPHHGLAYCVALSPHTSPPCHTAPSPCAHSSTARPCLLCRTESSHSPSVL
jgi:hypothetical protein